VKAWIGLGGNREDSRALLSRALSRLEGMPGIRLLRQSRCYRSPPWGVADQPDFANAVAELETGLPPLALLRVLLDLERELGRERGGERWGPRCIDLDLLTYEEIMLHSDELVLPHPRMHARAFVLVPLLEVEPDFIIPGRGSAAHCLQRLDPREAAGVVPLTPLCEE
jgi:2-amino-4-hydroxy-6-hydroxymethyldihydropteridine diphosphokinase